MTGGYLIASRSRSFCTWTTREDSSKNGDNSGQSYGSGPPYPDWCREVFDRASFRSTSSVHGMYTRCRAGCQEDRCSQGRVGQGSEGGCIPACTHLPGYTTSSLYTPAHHVRQRHLRAAGGVPLGRVIPGGGSSTLGRVASQEKEDYSGQGCSTRGKRNPEVIHPREEESRVILDPLTSGVLRALLPYSS